jgi:hypothetical protein
LTKDDELVLVIAAKSIERIERIAKPEKKRGGK